MKRILLGLLFLSGFLMAEETFVLYVDSPEMVKLYYNVFEAIKRVFRGDSYWDSLQIIFLLGGFFSLVVGIIKTWTAQARGALRPFITYIFVGFSLLLIGYGNATMIIKSQSWGSYCAGGDPDSTSVINTTVEKFPYFLGVTFYAMNRFGEVFTELAEDNFKTENAAALSIRNGGYNHGVMETMSILQTDLSLDKNVSNGTMGFSLKNLLAQCIIIPFSGKGDEGSKEIDAMISSGNIFQYLDELYDDTSTKTVGGVRPYDYSLSYGGEYYKCGDYYQTVKDQKNDFLEAARCTFGISPAGASLIMGGTLPSAANFDEIIMQAGAVNTMKETYSELGIGASAISGYVVGKSRAETMATHISTGIYMSKVFPILQQTLRVIIYAFMPFVFLFVFFPGGMKVLGMYIRSLFWIEMWTPVAAILNMLLSMKASDALTTTYNTNGLTMYTSTDMLSTSSAIAGSAGYLYLMIPGLTWAFMNGIALMLEGMGRHFGMAVARNIKTETVNLDQAKIAQQKEVSTTLSQQVGNASGTDNIGLAEMQHYEAIQQGRIDGSNLGLDMKAGMENIVDQNQANHQKEITEYTSSKKFTGMGGALLGEHLGREAGHGIAIRALTAANVLDNTLKGSAEGEGGFGAGKIQAQNEYRRTKNMGHGVEKLSIAQDKGKADHAHRHSYGDLSRAHQYGLEYAYGKNIALQSPESAESLGRLQTSNEKFNAAAKAAEIEALRRIYGPSAAQAVGQAQAMENMIQIERSDAMYDIAKMTGKSIRDVAGMVAASELAITYASGNSIVRQSFAHGGRNNLRTSEKTFTPKNYHQGQFFFQDIVTRKIAAFYDKTGISRERKKGEMLYGQERNTMSRRKDTPSLEGLKKAAITVDILESLRFGLFGVQSAKGLRKRMLREKEGPKRDLLKKGRHEAEKKAKKHRKELSELSAKEKEVSKMIEHEMKKLEETERMLNAAELDRIQREKKEIKKQLKDGHISKAEFNRKIEKLNAQGDPHLMRKRFRDDFGVDFDINEIGKLSGSEFKKLRRQIEALANPEEVQRLLEAVDRMREQGELLRYKKELYFAKIETDARLHAVTGRDFSPLKHKEPIETFKSTLAFLNEFKKNKSFGKLAEEDINKAIAELSRAWNNAQRPDGSFDKKSFERSAQQIAQRINAMKAGFFKESRRLTNQLNAEYDSYRTSIISQKLKELRASNAALRQYNQELPVLDEVREAYMRQANEPNGIKKFSDFIEKYTEHMTYDEKFRIKSLIGFSNSVTKDGTSLWNLNEPEKVEKVLEKTKKHVLSQRHKVEVALTKEATEWGDKMALKYMSMKDGKGITRAVGEYRREKMRALKRLHASKEYQDAVRRQIELSTISRQSDADIVNAQKKFLYGMKVDPDILRDKLKARLEVMRSSGVFSESEIEVMSRRLESAKTSKDLLDVSSEIKIATDQAHMKITQKIGAMKLSAVEEALNNAELSKKNVIRRVMGPAARIFSDDGYNPAKAMKTIGENETRLILREAKEFSRVLGKSLHIAKGGVATITLAELGNAVSSFDNKFARAVGTGIGVVEGAVTEAVVSPMELWMMHSTRSEIDSMTEKVIQYQKEIDEERKRIESGGLSEHDRFVALSRIEKLEENVSELSSRIQSATSALHAVRMRESFVTKNWNEGVKKFNESSWTSVGFDENYKPVLGQVYDAGKFLSSDVGKELMSRISSGIAAINAMDITPAEKVVEAEKLIAKETERIFLKKAMEEKTKKKEGGAT